MAMLNVLVAVILGGAILLPATSALARDDDEADRANYRTSGQVDLDLVPAPPAIVAPVDPSRE